ncbi:MAG: DUF1638 domain-containing protein [Alphaproteobacteria bacterium]|nr:DUF1638 domain-containing protein [Alphaproteobacteria bacterium]
MTKLELGPADYFAQNFDQARVLLLACGALAREIVDLIEVNQWRKFDIQCLPAKWHNTPHFIVPALREKIRAYKANYKSIFVLYGDCGTGGQLDAMLAEEGVERLRGPHCYAFFSGNESFAKTEPEDFTSFYLTDYLARHFDKLMWQGLGLDKHPELRDDYFRHYTKVIYLAQTKDAELEEKAKVAATKLGLDYEYRFTGYGELKSDLEHRTGE